MTTSTIVLDQRRLTLGTGVTFEKTESSFKVHSPVLREMINIGADLEDLVSGRDQPQTGQLIIDQWLTEHGQPVDAPIRSPLQEAVNNLVDHGVLVEEIDLSHEEAEALIFSEISEANKTALSQGEPYWNRTLKQVQGLLDWETPLTGRQDGQKTEAPFQVCRRPDGKYVLFDRAEQALQVVAQGQGLSVTLLPREAFLWNAVEAPKDFFGTQRVGFPYQGVYLDGQPLIRGIRMDLNDRLDMLDPQDIVGKNVLDLGSNYGMNCFLAVERGAKSAFGAEYSKALVVSGLRLNTFYGKPCEFISWDLNTSAPVPDNIDTVFFFALIGHLNTVSAVFETILASKAKVVYLETHCDEQSQGELERFLAWNQFTEVTKLGNSFDNNFKRTYSREVFRCRLV